MGVYDEGQVKHRLVVEFNSFKANDTTVFECRRGMIVQLSWSDLLQEWDEVEVLTVEKAIERLRQVVSGYEAILVRAHDFLDNKLPEREEVVLQEAEA